MQPLSNANPKTVREAVGLLGRAGKTRTSWPGGTDLLSLLKDYIHAQRVVSLKGIQDLGGLPDGGGAAYRRDGHAG